jgi:hypothetical protein
VVRGWNKKCETPVFPEEYEGLLACTNGQVGARRLELQTSSLSGTRSNQLSYAPETTQVVVAWATTCNAYGQFYHDFRPCQVLLRFSGAVTLTWTADVAFGESQVIVGQHVAAMSIIAVT